MALNKFEKHIKGELAKREIKPSEEAWNKVVAQLDTPSKSGSKSVLWYGIAASFAGFLLVSLFFFNKGEQAPTPRVSDVDGVERDLEKEIPTPGLNGKTGPQKSIELVDRANGVEKKRDGVSEVVPQNQEFDGEGAKNTPSSSVVSTEILETDKTVKENALDSPEGVIDAKVHEIVAQVALLEKSNAQQITDMEIDSLLRKAQQEIMAEKLFKENGKVDAMALLTDVEEELDQSFRDQIFDKLKTGFLKVRTAVADRNN